MILAKNYIEILFERKTIGEVLLLITTFFWGSTFILVKLTIEIMPVFTFLTIRFFLAAIVSLPIFIFRYKKTAISLKDNIIKGGIIGVTLWISFAFQTVGLVYTTATIAAFLTGLNVIITPVLGILLFRLKVKRNIIIGAILAFFGVSLLSGILELDLSQSQAQWQLFGNVLIIICAIAVAFHILLTERFAPSIDPTGLLFFQLITATILSMVTMLISQQYQPEFLIFSNWDIIIWLTLIVTVFFATVFAFLVQSYYQSKRIISGSRIAVIFAFEPVFAALTSLVMLQEPLSLFGIIGAILIFSAMIISRGKNEVKPKLISKDK